MSRHRFLQAVHWVIIGPAWITAGSGCGQGNGVLTVQSGPPQTDGANAPVYFVHVGERANLTFETKIGKCDYAVLHDERGDRYDDCGPPIAGRFLWPEVFDQLSAPQAPARFTVTGYVQQGRRDAMPVGGRLVEGRPPNDPADVVLASTTVLVEIYQSAAEWTIKPPPDSPDWARSRITIRRDDGKSARAGLAGRSTRGFHVSGPDANGAYRVRYEPTADEVNKQGETVAELQVADETGRTQSFATKIATP